MLAGAEHTVSITLSVLGRSCALPTRGLVLRAQTHSPRTAWTGKALHSALFTHAVRRDPNGERPSCGPSRDWRPARDREVISPKQTRNAACYSSRQLKRLANSSAF